MTVKSSIDFLDSIYEMFKSKFKNNITPGFHNLLWQLIVNDVHANKIMCFHVVPGENAGWQITMVFANEGGHQPTGVLFDREVGVETYDDAMNVVRRLNKELFGLDKNTVDRIVKVSMDLPVEA